MTSRREITLSPTTRIEGQGKVTILLDDDGNVLDAHFHATEIRGFEYFMRGMEADTVPFIISRICGVCSTAHVMASVKAIERVYETEITQTARRLRELLLMGQIVSNHSLVFFFLTLPDFWFPMEEDPSKRNIFQIMRMNPEIGRKAIRIRTFGTHLLRVIGRREVHIVSVIPGGLMKPLGERERQVLLKQAEEACMITREAVELGKDLFEKNWDRFQALGDSGSCYMGLVMDDALEFYDAKVRLLGCDGTIETELDEQNYMDYIEEKSFPWTYAKFAYFKRLGWPEGTIQVGPTARMNVSRRISTPMANEEIQEFKRRFGSPAHATLLLDYARLIDLLYACERTKQLLEDENITKTDTRVPVRPKAGEGVGIVEAPRGTLAHRYVLSRTGKLREIKLMIPTQVNNAAINISVKEAASRFIVNGEIKPGLLNGVE
ncbi:MAG: Ni/Fe hydrogenase subunit alpha, partial [Candidatus Bathyarchaeota archaeon]|nr:Ni/Fe hydrogenase subunit alpha [Candidatus Bathyarchaeota archaeon]